MDLVFTDQWHKEKVAQRESCPDMSIKHVASYFTLPHRQALAVRAPSLCKGLCQATCAPIKHPPVCAKASTHISCSSHGHKTPGNRRCPGINWYLRGSVVESTGVWVGSGPERHPDGWKVGQKGHLPHYS